MPGFVPNDRIRTFMEEHDMLVVPSVVHTNGDRDGIPNVIMEALSCGMPVVATDVCGVGEVIRNGETGYLIPQRDPAALADAIRRMLSDREAALRMAQTGRELVFRMFDTETNIAGPAGSLLPTVHAVAHHPRPQRLERDHRGRGPSASTEVGPSPALFSGALSESCPAVVSRGAPSGSAPCRERKQSLFPRSATVFRRSPFPDTCNRRPAA